MKTIQEIKTAVDQGKTVHWLDKRYKVVKANGDYIIKSEFNGLWIGSINVLGDKLNGLEKDFFI